MSTADYTLPVAQLLALGDVRDQDDIDYLALGLGPEHVPALCRMVLDEDLAQAGTESDEVWSGIHAWRALAQIGSPDAVDALVTLMGRIAEDDNDWAMSELPDVFTAIGPAALPALERFLADDEQDMWPRLVCAECLEEMVKAHPETRDVCVGIVTRQLGEFARQPETLNGFLISSLIDWQAVETAPLIEAAFQAGQVDFSVAGDWEEVQVGLGLLSERITPAPNFFLSGFSGGTPPYPVRLAGTAAPSVHSVERKQKAKAKSKRKQEKRSRRQQRK